MHNTLGMHNPLLLLMVMPWWWWLLLVSWDGCCYCRFIHKHSHTGQDQTGTKWVSSLGMRAVADKWWMVPGGCVSVTGVVVINVAPFNAIAVSQREIVTDSTVDHNESRGLCPGFVGASNLIIHVNCHPAAWL